MFSRQFKCPYIHKGTEVHNLSADLSTGSRFGCSRHFDRSWIRKDVGLELRSAIAPCSGLMMGLALQSVRRCFDSGFQFVQEGFTLQARFDWREKLNDNRAGLARQRPPRPEQSGIECDGHDRQVQPAVERDDTGLVRLSGSRCRSCPLGEDYNGLVLVDCPFCGSNHRLQGACTSTSIDRDHARLKRIPAVEG